MLRKITIDLNQEDLSHPVNFSESGEPIFAVMITGTPTRSHFAKNSILSFLAQTYPNKYLIIINDGDYSFDVKGIPSDRIRQVQLQTKEILGTLRNKAFEYIPANAVFIQWDDDDWHAPKIIAEQYAVLQEHEVDTCLLGNQIKYAIPKNSAWDDTTPSYYHGFAGTIMMRHKMDLRYPAWPRHEDSEFFLTFLRRHYTHIRWHNPSHYYIRFIHDHNTSTHFQLSERKENEWLFSTKASRYLKEILELYNIRPAEVAL